MASRSVVRRSGDRGAWVRPAPVRRRSRFRLLRRLFVLAIVLGALALIAWGYMLQVYAPGLRSEASSIPVRVQQSLAAERAPYVPIGQIAPDMQNAIVAIEDRRFYSHPGIDPLGMARAMWVNLTQQHVDQGGSTLEQQLVKRTLVPDDRTVHGKLRTIALAWAVDQDFSKHRIIELYLNAAYYGQGAYGIGAAAQVYFGTDAAHLTLPEAALLASLPQAPSVYGANPGAAVVRARQATTLNDMAQLGYITPAEAQAAAAAPLHFDVPAS